MYASMCIVHFARQSCGVIERQQSTRRHQTVSNEELASLLMADAMV